MESLEVYAKRWAQGQELFGTLFPTRPPYKKEGVRGDYEDYIERFGVGEVWTRPGLDAKTRCALTIAMDIPMRNYEEMETHMAMGITAGLTPDEIREILFHAVPYCGVPPVRSAWKVADKVLGGQMDS